MGATRTLKVMLVEDHSAFREALAFMLSGEPDIEVVAQAGSLAEARDALEGGLESRLDVAVVDLGLPDGDGSVLIGELRKSHPGVSVVVLSAAMGPRYLDEAVKAGSDVVLDKVESIPTIAEEVRRLGGNEPHPSARRRP
jgi:DNA-binding NarL/FixJ family response regulator